MLSCPSQHSTLLFSFTMYNLNLAFNSIWSTLFYSLLPYYSACWRKERTMRSCAQAALSSPLKLSWSYSLKGSQAWSSYYAKLTNALLMLFVEFLSIYDIITSHAANVLIAALSSFFWCLNCEAFSNNLFLNCIITSGHWSDEDCLRTMILALR